MCFPPEIKRLPLSSPVAPSANSKSRSDGPPCRPRVSEDFDRAVSQFMAGFQAQQPVQTQQNISVSPLVAGRQTLQSAKQNWTAFQKQAAKQAVSQVDLLAQLQRRADLTVTRQQPLAAVGFPSAGNNGTSLTFSSTGLTDTSALLSAAPLRSSAPIHHTPVSSIPGIPAVSPPSVGIPASFTLSCLLSSGPGVTIPGVNPLDSSIISAVSPLSNNMISAESPLSALGINFASSSAKLDSDEDEEKKVRRIMSNRQSAKRSRQRKRERLDELEEEVAALTQAREEANRKLKESETSVEGLRAANERMEEEAERLRREISLRGRQSQVSSQLPSQVISPAVPAAEFFEAVPACDEASPAKKLRGIEYNGGAAEVIVNKVNNPSSPTSDVTRTYYTCSEASLKEEAVVGDGLGFFGGGLGAMDDMGCLLGEAPQGLNFLDDALVRAMLECMGGGELL